MDKSSAFSGPYDPKHALATFLAIIVGFLVIGVPLAMVIGWVLSHTIGPFLY